MLRSKDVGSNMMWCCSNELSLVSQPVKLDPLDLVIGLLLPQHHIGGTKPANLVEQTLACISPEPYTLTNFELSILAFVATAKSTA